MSEDQINSEISAKEDAITKVEEAAAKKEASAEKEVEAEYDSQISDAESKLATEQGLLEEATEKAAEWKLKQKEKKGTVKALEKEVKSLKSQKSKALKTKLNDIAKEKKTNISALTKEIKTLKKDLSALQSATAQEE